ncbi:MAG: topoisomerase C-terminal repeat-containing protein, partial [Patescibacteria group bacterium]
ELKRVGADIAARRYTFRATGQTILFDGFLRLYLEGKDEGPSTGSRATGSGQGREDDVDVEKGDMLLPPLAQGDPLDLQELKPEQHFTKPPPRYTEASLVKKLEEEGIGRPSTYAPTISTIQQRGYIKKEGKQLAPELIAFTVTDLLAEHFKDIVDTQFTARMEQALDDIAEGEVSSTDFLGGFFKPFTALVKEKTKEIQKADVLPERALGKDPQTGLPVVVRIGRFGPYVQLGRLEDAPREKGAKARKSSKPKLKSASVPKHLSSEGITLEQALALLSFPKELGLLEGVPVVLAVGRFGPYLKCGETTVSVKDRDITAITLADAGEIIKESKEQRRRAAEPLRNFGKDPDTGGTILLKDGRFGPYVTDGKTNASLGKKLSPETLTLEQAIDLLRKKRARGPSKWRRRG